MKSFKPRDRNETEPPTDDAGGGRNAMVDFKGEKRTNETHRSTTDPQAMLYRKGPGMEAKLCFIGHGLMENRSGLIVDARLTLVSGHAERLAAVEMIEPFADRPRAITLGADKGYDTADFVEELRTMNVRPHVARKARFSAIDGRTTRHRSYGQSQRIRKRIEEAFGWIKTIAGLRKTRFITPRTEGEAGQKPTPRVGAQFSGFRDIAETKRSAPIRSQIVAGGREWIPNRSNCFNAPFGI